MDGINIKKSEALEVLTMKIQCDVCWNRYIFQCLIFLRRDTIFWSTSLHSKENGIQLLCVGRCFNVYFDVNGGRVSNLLIHWNSVAIWLVFHCSIAIATDFAPAKQGDLLPRIMYSNVTLVFIGKHIRMWSIGQWIAHCMTNKIHFLAGLFVCRTPLAQML